MKQKMSKWLIAGMLMGNSAMAATEIKGVKLSDSYQLNGQALQLNGAAFCAAVLRNWLGSNPVDGDLKKSLLGT